MIVHSFRHWPIYHSPRVIYWRLINRSTSFMNHPGSFINYGLMPDQSPDYSTEPRINFYISWGLSMHSAIQFRHRLGWDLIGCAIETLALHQSTERWCLITPFKELSKHTPKHAEALIQLVLPCTLWGNLRVNMFLVTFMCTMSIHDTYSLTRI